MVHSTGVALSELVVADGTCPKIRELLATSQAPVLWLDGQQDPLIALSHALEESRANGTPIHTLHWLGHGAPGVLLVGNTTINTKALLQAERQLASWQLNTIALWSCSTGTDHDFLSVLKELTGATVWASDQALGRLKDGSRSWQLKSSSQRKAPNVSPDLPIHTSQKLTWNHQLGAFTTNTPIAPADPVRTHQERRNRYAFAALKTDGSVVTWGASDYGGDSSGVDLSSGVSQIFSNQTAFAAVKTDGSVITWGNSNGGDSSGVDLSSGVSQIFSTNNSFAALKTDGSVITWGHSSFGGDSSSVSSSLSSDVVGFANPFTNDIYFPGPIYTSAATSTDGTKVILTYDETLSSTTASTSDFAIKTDGAANAVTAVAISGSTVELTLTNTINTGEAVTVAYTDPSASNDTKAVQDSAGNDAASLNSTSVTNNSTVATDSSVDDSLTVKDGITEYGDSADWLANQKDIRLRMMGGDDYIEITGGVNNFANGNNGSDQIVLKAGQGKYHGGAGNDTFTVLGGSNNYINSDKGRDKITLNSGLNKALGGDDNDSIEVLGATAGSWVNGNNGNDFITGVVAGVTYRGGKDDDVLAVSQGDVWGDLGVDTFQGVSGDGYALIQDYTVGEDKIDLSLVQRGSWKNVDNGLMFSDTSGDQIMLLTGIISTEVITLI